jgi:hypothetical protein
MHEVMIKLTDSGALFTGVWLFTHSSIGSPATGFLVGFVSVSAFVSP